MRPPSRRRASGATPAARMGGRACRRAPRVRPVRRSPQWSGQPAPSRSGRTRAARAPRAARSARERRRSAARAPAPPRPLPPRAGALGEPQGLLGGVDGEHVVADLHVQPGGLLVEAHQRKGGGTVLDQVDALLMVLDRLRALSLVCERGADLAVQLGYVLEIVSLAV